MFAGITAILLNEDGTVITGIASKDGEEVVFVNPVSTVDYAEDERVAVTGGVPDEDVSGYRRCQGCGICPCYARLWSCPPRCSGVSRWRRYFPRAETLRQA